MARKEQFMASLKAGLEMAQQDKAAKLASEALPQQTNEKVREQKEKQANDISVYKQLQDMAPGDTSVSVNGIGTGKAPNYAMQDAQIEARKQQAQVRDYNNLKKTAKPIDALNTELDHAHYMHALLDNPNKLDEGQFNTLKGLSAAGGGGSRALATIMRAQGTDQTALQGDYQNFLNKISGSANTVKSPEQLQAARDSTLKYQDEILSRYDDQKQKFKQQAPMAAPSIFASGQLPQLLDSELAPIENKANELRQRKSDYMQRQSAGQNPGPSTIGAPQGNPGAPGLMDRLKGAMMGGQPTQQAPAAAPQAPGISFEEFKRRKAAGQL